MCSPCDGAPGRLRSAGTPPWLFRQSCEGPLRIVRTLIRRVAFGLLATSLGFTILCLPSGDALRAQIIEKNIRRGIADGPVRLDPQFARMPAEIAVLTDLFIGLVAEDPAGAIVPGAAESWDTSADGLTWTFRLRPDQKWSDGRPVEARDFVYAFQRLLAPDSGAPFASMFYNIAGAEALNRGRSKDSDSLGVKAKGAQTVIFTLTHRSPEFLSLLVHHAAFPVRQDLIEKDAEAWTRPGRMVTNGAYSLAEWLPGRYIRLAKNWNFFDSAAVRIDNVFYEIFDVPEAGIEKFFGGELEIFANVPRDQAGELVRSAPRRIRIYPTLTVDYLVINVTKAPFDDPRVRQALALAIDSPTLVQKALQDGEMPADGFLPQGIGGLREPPRAQPEGPYPVPRPFTAAEKRGMAKEMMADAGLGAQDSVSLTLHYNLSDTNEKVAEAVADMLSQIGVTVVLYGADYAVHYGDLAAGDFDIARAGWIADFNDPAAYLMLFRQASDPFNYGHFTDDQFEKLMTQASKQDALARAATLGRAAERIAELNPVIPLYQHASRNLVAVQVTGWRDNLRDIHPSRYLDLTP